MTWFAVDDSFHSHPKVMALASDPAALGLWVIAGSWSCANLTDGFVPDYALPRLAEGSRDLAKQLVAAGLWRRAKGGYRFHDWSVYQESRTERLQKREEWRAKKAEQRAKRKARGEEPQVKGEMSPGDNPGDSPGESRERPALPSPSPSPSPTPSVGGSQSSSSTRRNGRASDDDDRSPEIDKRITELLADLTGRTVPPDWAAKIRRDLIDGRDVTNPYRYVSRAIRERPKDFLPPPGPAEPCPVHPYESQPCRSCAADRKAVS
ncbi:hypothetical protein ACWEQG_01590 [Microbispora sp. NPDC004025]